MLTTSTGQGRIRHVLTTEHTTLLGCLVRSLDLGIDGAQQLIAFGAVYLDRHRTTSDCAVRPGQYIRVHLKPRRYPIDGIHWNERIVYQDALFIVVNKPAGIPVHATLDNGAENLISQLSAALGSPLFITHRLDTEVGGLLVVSKTTESQGQFNRLLAERKVQKRYRALVQSAPSAGRYVHYMAPGKRGPKTVTDQVQPNGLYCALSVLKAERLDATHMPCGFDMEIDLETGRTHQIRAQLSALGSPIVGDTLYGSAVPFELKGALQSGIALFSASSSWTTPEGIEYSFHLSPPWALFSEKCRSVVDLFGRRSIS